MVGSNQKVEAGRSQFLSDFTSQKSYVERLLSFRGCHESATNGATMGVTVGGTQQLKVDGTAKLQGKV